MVFNATFNNMLVISWRSVLLMEEHGRPGENHQPVATHNINIPTGTTSVLNLQNINRNQAGSYQCTTSNDVSSKTSVVVNVVVQCKYLIHTII